MSESQEFKLTDRLEGITTQRQFKHFKDAGARDTGDYTLRDVTFKWDNCTLEDILYYATSEVKTRKGQAKAQLGKSLTEMIVSPPGVRTVVDAEAAYLAKHGGDLDAAIADLMAKKEKADAVEEFKKRKNEAPPKRGR